jgi:uncharacterized protein YodC (DUF2158 family)
MKPEIGAPVRLRSGGPTMTIQSFRERGEEIDNSYLCVVFCRWFDETKHLCEANFDLRTLELCTAQNPHSHILSDQGILG